MIKDMNFLIKSMIMNIVIYIILILLETTTSYSIKTELNSVLNADRAKNFQEINYQIILHDDNYWVNRIISNLSIENIEYTSYW